MTAAIMTGMKRGEMKSLNKRKAQTAKARAAKKDSCLDVYSTFVGLVMKHFEAPLRKLNEDSLKRFPKVWTNGHNRERLARALRAYINIFFRSC